MLKADGKVLKSEEKELKVDGDALKGERKALNDNGKAVNAKRRSWSVKWWWRGIKVNGEELKGDVWYAFRARRRRQGKQRGVINDGKALKGDGKALSDDGEALRMTEDAAYA